MEGRRQLAGVVENLFNGESLGPLQWHLLAGQLLLRVVSEQSLTEGGSSQECVNNTTEMCILVSYSEQEGSNGRLATENRLGLSLVSSVL